MGTITIRDWLAAIRCDSSPEQLLRAASTAPVVIQELGEQYGGRAIVLMYSGDTEDYDIY